MPSKARVAHLVVLMHDVIIYMANVRTGTDAREGVGSRFNQTQDRNREQASPNNPSQLAREGIMGHNVRKEKEHMSSLILSRSLHMEPRHAVWAASTPMETGYQAHDPTR